MIAAADWSPLLVSVKVVVSLVEEDDRVVSGKSVV